MIEAICAAAADDITSDQSSGLIAPTRPTATHKLSVLSARQDANSRWRCESRTLTTASRTAVAVSSGQVIRGLQRTRCFERYVQDQHPVLRRFHQRLTRKEPKECGNDVAAAASGSRRKQYGRRFHCVYLMNLVCLQVPMSNTDVGLHGRLDAAKRCAELDLANRETRSRDYSPGRTPILCHGPVSGPTASDYTLQMQCAKLRTPIRKAIPAVTVIRIRVHQRIGPCWTLCAGRGAQPSCMPYCDQRTSRLSLSRPRLKNPQ
jgi:hypothetical protein